MNNDQENIKDQEVSKTDLSKDEVLSRLGIPHETVKVSDALEQVPVQEGKISTIKTFQSDIAGAVKSDNISMIKIALAEKERREKEGAYADVDIKKKFNPLYYVAAVLIVLIGLSVVFVYYYFNKPLPPTIEDIVAPEEPELVYSDSQVLLPTDDRISFTLLEEIRNEVDKKQDLGTIKRIMPVTENASGTKNLTSQEFLSKIRSRMPDTLNRAIDPYFFLGVYSFYPHDTVLIFKINSYDNAFPGMLAWEQAIDLDIGKIMYGSVIAEPGAGAIDGTSSTSTIKTTNDPNKPIWKDKIIQNKDTRVLVDANGNVKFLYSFLDRKTLVIVSSEKGLKEVISRTTTGKIRR